MVGPNEAFVEIGKALRKHVERNTLEKIVEELQDVPGDKTFREAIEHLSHELLKRPAKADAELVKRKS